MEVTAWVYELEEDLEDLLTTHEVIASTRYRSQGESAGRHGNNTTLDWYICKYSDAFLRLFRMH